MKRILSFIITILSLVGCGATQYVPTTTIDRIIYRDTTIVINDTIMVPIEKEVIKEVIPELDTSYLETSVAKSVAYLDTAKRQLHHTLTQEGKVEYIVDTFYTTTYVDRYVEKPVIQEVEVEKPYIPSIFWWITGYALIVSIIIAMRVYLKIKGV